MIQSKYLLEYLLESGIYWNTLHFIGILHILYSDFKKNMLDLDSWQTLGLFIRILDGFIGSQHKEVFL